MILQLRGVIGLGQESTNLELQTQVRGSMRR